MSQQPADPSSPKPQQGGLTLGPGAQITVGQGDIVAGDKIVYASKEDARTRRDHLILLNKVKEFWVKGVLEKSVHAEALIELGKQTQAGAVERERPWDIKLETSEQESHPILPGKKIVEIFGETDRALLILGAPGSGKTITLLELARDLIARAEADPAQPIPVVFNLSAWAERRQPLTEWMTDELSLKYQIPRKIGRKWLENNDILPLLDGLDEAQAEHRADCVEAINAFYGEHSLAGIAVCSRHEEYSLLKAKLKLGSAILIQSLNDEQVTDYLASFGTKLAGLYKALKLDAVLKELAASPLMLGVMSLAYVDVSLEDVLRGKLESVEARRKHLFDAYVERMFKRKGADKRYTPEQTMRCLTWLAQGLKTHKQTVFLIEGLQPSWLKGRMGQWGYALVAWLIVGLIIGIGAGLFWIGGGGVVAALLRNFFAGLVSGLIGGFLAGLIRGLQFAMSARPRGVANTPGSNLWQPAMGLVFTALSVGLCSGLAVVPFHTLISLLFLKDTFALAQQLGIISSEWMSALTGGLFGGLTYGTTTGAAFGLIFGLRVNGKNMSDDLQIVDALSWSWTSALKWTPGGAVIGLLGGMIVGVVFGPVFALASNTPDHSPFYILAGVCLFGGGLGVAGLLLGGMSGGLIGGLRGKRIESRSSPNQGLRWSIKNALLAGLLFWIGGWFVFGLSWGLFFSFAGGLISGLSYGAVLGLSFGLIFAIVGALWYGGLAVVQHYTLRLIITLNKHLPWNLAPFLDHCAGRIFLQKVGGGYIFIHRLLLEYFAERE
jgi:hypothetical protein